MESPVVVADLDNPAFVASRDTYDHTHPTPTGEMLIAQQVAEALQGYGVLPAAPDIAQATVPWTPPVTAAVHRVGPRLALAWPAVKHRYRAREMRARWTSVLTGRTVTSRWKRGTHLRTGALARGTYRIQLQARRRTMISSWGPSVVRHLHRGS